MKKIWMVVLCCVVVVWWVQACTAETAGKRIRFAMAAEGAVWEGGTRESFVNRQGWQVALREARMWVGPLYLYEGAPRVQHGLRFLGREGWFAGGLFSEAYAHPGHITADNRKVLGEVLEARAVDLMGQTPSEMGLLEGVEGQLESLEFQLLPPSGASSQSMEGVSFLAKGKASKGGEEHSFQVKLTLPEGTRTRVIEQIAADLPLRDQAEKAGSVVFQIGLAQIFANVDFSAVEEKDDAGALLLTSATQALVQGVRSRYSYRAIWR